MNRHLCNIYIHIFFNRDGLSLGSSKHWRDALEILTGERELNANAMVEYFQPLYEYLKKENNKSAANSIQTSVVSCVVMSLFVFWILK